MEFENLSQEEAKEKALTAVADFIQQVQPGAMVTSFVLLVVAVDDKDRWLFAFSPPGQKQWESMGLLDYAMMLEQSAVLEEGDEE